MRQSAGGEDTHQGGVAEMLGEQGSRRVVHRRSQKALIGLECECEREYVNAKLWKTRRVLRRRQTEQTKHP